MAAIDNDRIMILGGMVLHEASRDGILLDAKTLKVVGEITPTGPFAFKTPNNQHHITKSGNILAMVSETGENLNEMHIVEVKQNGSEFKILKSLGNAEDETPIEDGEY